MIANLKSLYLLLTAEQRRKLLRLQVLVVIMAFAEIAGVVAIGPFMGLVGNMSRFQGNGLVASLYHQSGLSSPQDFLFWLGIGVLGVLFLAGVFSMFTVWRLSLYGAQVGAQISSRLFAYYMQQPWLFHAVGNSSTLTKQIAQESQRVANSIINPLMQVNAKLALVLFMSVAIFIYNPGVAVSGVALFVAAYFLLYKTVRRRLVVNGREISDAQALRFKLMGEGFGGIKDVLLLGRQRNFTERFDQASDRFAYAMGTTQALSQAPRYAVETVAYGAIIFLVLYLLSAYGGNVSAILPVLSVYALAGFKLLPAFQAIYTNFSNIRGNLAAFEAIRNDLSASDKEHTKMDVPGSETVQMHMAPRHSVVLDNLVFSYPGKSERALDGVSLTIPAKQVIGLVGATGSGKSTLIDLLLGLVDPDQGEVRIDGEPLNQNNKRAWQNTLGFVPQSIFLADASMRENIAFGLRPDAIDDKQVKRAASMAHLDELLEHLPDGLNTRVGERGVQLSGGQRQRIGIARALYHDADMLVLDEATSALDGITEKLIMDAIHDFSGSKTIIMIAHRLATVKQCDRIYLMKAGRVVDQGRYDDLADRNEIFKRMALHA
jgi:ABC-type multidrug transport system fused ATPase/permease subunit